MVGRPTWYCKCGWRGKDVGRVAKHQAKGKGHYRVELVVWAQGEMERVERDKAKGVREQAKHDIA